LKNIILQSLKKSALSSFLVLIALLLLSSFDDDFHTNVITNILDYFGFFFTGFLIGFLTSYKIKAIYLGISISAILTFVVNFGLNELFSNLLFPYRVKLVGAAAILASVLTYLFSRSIASSKKVKLGTVAYPFTNSIFFYFIVSTLYAIIFVWALSSEASPYKEWLRFLYNILFIDSIVIFTITFFLFKFIYQYVEKRTIAIYSYYFIILSYYLLICFFKYNNLEGAMNIRNLMSYLLARVPFIFMIIASIQISYLIQYSKNEKKQLIQQSFESQLNYQQLKNQLAPVKSYLDLLKDRFEIGFNFSIAIDEQSEEKHIVSTILQQVLENVVKHNIINETSPIEIKITSSDDYLVIENNKNPKLKTIQHSKKGIENIKMRIAFFTDQKVIIDNNKTHYSIKLPILELAE